MKKGKGSAERVVENKSRVARKSKSEPAAHSFALSGAVLENPTLLRQVIDCLSIGFALFDPQDRLIAFNVEFQRLSGLSKKILQGNLTFEQMVRQTITKNGVSYSGKDKRLWIKSRLTAHRNPGAPIEARFKNGGWVRIQERRTKSGYTASSYEDISELKNRELRLLESARIAEASQERLEEAVESMSEGFVLFDSENRLVLCNSHYRNRVIGASKIVKPGVTRRELIKAVADYRFKGVPKKEKSDWIKERSAFINTPGLVYETQFPDGCWFRSQDFLTNDGGRVCLYADITERKQVEEALVEAKNMAEIANRAKTEFLANVSHELRTPLNAIIGFSELMKIELFGPIGDNKYSEYASTINDSGQHLLAIINDILDVGRIEVSELDFRPEKVPLQPVFESCLRLVQERANLGGLSLKRNIQHALPMLKADPRRLKQILLNLLSNAVKFTPKGGAVTLKAHLTKTGTLVISVSDTGIGMKASDIPKAMTPFVQVDSKLSRKYEGTGLGLPITQALINQHGANMKIKSKARKGTTVSVYFPADLQTR